MNEPVNSVQIRVLGTGCPKCRKTLANARAAVEQLGIEAEVSLVKDIKEISQYVVFPPGVLLNGKVVAEGYVVPVTMFVEWLSQKA